jgi:hypothetical protein
MVASQYMVIKESQHLTIKKVKYIILFNQKAYSTNFSWFASTYVYLRRSTLNSSWL